MTKDKGAADDHVSAEPPDVPIEVHAWPLKNIQPKGQVIRPHKKKPNQNEKIEVVTPKEKPKPLTAEDLQKIAEQAKKDGHREGLDSGQKQGYQDGLAKGLQEGENKAYQEMMEKINIRDAQILAICSRLFDPMQQQESDIELSLVHTAMSLAKHIVGAELSVKPSHLLNIVTQVVEYLPKSAQDIELVLNDNDADMLESLSAQRSGPNAKPWKIRRDTSLASGGCYVNTPDSSIDFSLESRLAEYLEKIDVLDPIPPLLPLIDIPREAPIHESSPNELTSSALSASEEISTDRPREDAVKSEPEATLEESPVSHNRREAVESASVVENNRDLAEDGQGDV